MMSQKDVFNKIYNCSSCTSEEKKKRKCTKEKKRNVFEYKCICDGDKKCDICNGKGYFKYGLCPKSVYHEFWFNRLLIHYFRYKKLDVFPDGKGMYFQTVKLIEAFSFMMLIENKTEQKGV